MERDLLEPKDENAATIQEGARTRNREAFIILHLTFISLEASPLFFSLLEYRLTLLPWSTW